MSEMELDGVAPPGWEKTIKKMKKSGDVDNPFALAWWMQNQKYKPSRKDESEEEAGFDPGLDAGIRLMQAGRIPNLCFMAACNDEYAQHVLLCSQPFVLEWSR